MAAARIDLTPLERDLLRGLADLLLPRDCAVSGEPIDTGEFRHLSDIGIRRLERIADIAARPAATPFSGWSSRQGAAPIAST